MSDHELCYSRRHFESVGSFWSRLGRSESAMRFHSKSPALVSKCLRWTGKSKPVRLGVRDHHTRSLCAESPAQMEQWCCWLCHHLLIEGDRGQFVPSRRRRMTGNVRAECLLKIPAEPSPELRISGAELKREWSPWPEFGSDPGNPRELGWCRPRKHPCRDPGLRPSCVSPTPQLKRE